MLDHVQFESAEELIALLQNIFATPEARSAHISTENIWTPAQQLQSEINQKEVIWFRKERFK